MMTDGGVADGSFEEHEREIELHMVELNHSTERLNRINIFYASRQKDLDAYRQSTHDHLQKLKMRLNTRTMSASMPFYRLLHRQQQLVLKIDEAEKEVMKKNDMRDSNGNLSLPVEQRAENDLRLQLLADEYMKINHDLEIEKAHTSAKALRKCSDYWRLFFSFEGELERRKKELNELSTCVGEVKRKYRDSMQSLEFISNKIHSRRGSPDSGFVDRLSVTSSSSSQPP